jgi:hypothetical protein
MTLTQRTLLVLLPELRDVPDPDWTSALRMARDTELDVPELLGMAVAVVAVTALTQYGVAGSSAWSHLAALLANFAVAVPLLALCVAPFHLRRLRRGLRSRAKQPGHS